MKIHRKLLPINNLFVVILFLIIPLNTSPVGDVLPVARLISAAQDTNSKSVVLTLAELAKLNSTGSTILQGNYARARYDLLVPYEWDIQPKSSMRLHITTNIGQPNLSPTFELSVLLNGQWVYETVVTNAGEQWIDFSFPDVWGAREGRADRLEFLVSTHAGCEQGLTQTTHIFFDSQVNLIYENKPLTFDMAKYPVPIYGTSFLPQTINIAMPDNSSNQEIEATLALIAELGRSSDNSLEMLAVSGLTARQAASLDTNLIIVGTPDNNPIIGQLQTTTSFPATLQPRRLELITTGPDIIPSGTELTYTVEVKNTEDNVVRDLVLNARLPHQLNIENLTCTPDCQEKEGQITWEIGTMNPAATSKFTVSLVSPQTPNTDPESFDFTSELLQRKEILNVSTLNSLMTESGSPQLITSTPKSGQFYVSNGSTVAESDGVIQLIPSPWFANRAVLIVTGSTNEGVYKAGRALGTKSNFPNFSGQLVLVRDVHPTESKSIEFLPEISLKQLGYSDQVITGLGVTNISYRFYLPSKYYLSQDAKFQFFFSHSALLDPTASSLTLTMNNTPFASVLLDESNAERGVIEAFLPVSASHPGELNSLGVTVNTQVPDLCSMSASGTNQLWVNLQSDSILSLPVVDNPLTNNYNLDRLPMPFVINPNLEQTKFALPLDPSDIEYAAAFRVAAWLASKSVGNNFNPKVILGTPGLEKELSDFNLIVIGRPSRNTMLQVLNDDLPQPFILGKDIIRQQVDNVIFRIPEEMDLGYMQLLQSKWNQENLILAITGTTDLSLHRVIDSLIDDIKNNSVKGNLVLIPNDVDVFATDTRSMLLSGKLNVLGTAIPAIGIIGTATPNLPTLETAPTEPPVQGIIRNRPSWLPFVSAILGAVLSVVVLRILYIRARSRQS